MHVHVSSVNVEAKFWLKPILALATHSGLTARELKQMQQAVEKYHDQIVFAWQKHFT